MKTKIWLLLTSLLLLACGQANRSEKSVNTQKKTQDFANSYSLFRLSEAERILGEPAHIKDSSLVLNDSLSVFQCAYESNKADPETAKTGIIYVMIEQYSKTERAKQVYTSIKMANEPHGIQVLDHLGDEAYFHTDKQNFYFILMRKDEKMLRMKVNKITGKTSLEEFNQVAKDITAAL